MDDRIQGTSLHQAEANRYTDPVKASPWLIRGAPVIFLLLWSGGYTVAKIGVSDADPLTLLSIRYASVLLLLTPIWLWIRPPLPASPRAWLDLALVGFLIQVVYFGGAWTAMHTGSSAGTVALITSLHRIHSSLGRPCSRFVWCNAGAGRQCRRSDHRVVGRAVVLSCSGGVQYSNYMGETTRSCTPSIDLESGAVRRGYWQLDTRDFIVVDDDPQRRSNTRVGAVLSGATGIRAHRLAIDR